MRRRPVRPCLAARNLTVVALAFLVGTLHEAGAQPTGCLLVSSADRPALRRFQCGEALTIVAEKGAAVETGAERPAGQAGIIVNRGAVLFEFKPNGAQSGFQILTPHAVAAVRGTTWAVDVQAARSSIFVVSGAVAVEGRAQQGTVLRLAGERTDVGPGLPLRSGPWPAERSRALLSRLGQ